MRNPITRRRVHNDLHRPECCDSGAAAGSGVSRIGGWAAGTETKDVTRSPKSGAESKKYALHFSSSPVSSPVRAAKSFPNAEMQKSRGANTHLGGHQIGRERPGFFGFQPPNSSRGRSRPVFRRGEDASVCRFETKVAPPTFFDISGEFFLKKALYKVGAEF